MFASVVTHSRNLLSAGGMSPVLADRRRFRPDLRGIMLHIHRVMYRAIDNPVDSSNRGLDSTAADGTVACRRWQNRGAKRSTHPSRTRQNSIGDGLSTEGQINLRSRPASNRVVGTVQAFAGQAGKTGGVDGSGNEFDVAPSLTLPVGEQVRDTGCRDREIEATPGQPDPHVHVLPHAACRDGLSSEHCSSELRAAATEPGQPRSSSPRDDATLTDSSTGPSHSVAGHRSV